MKTLIVLFAAFFTYFVAWEERNYYLRLASMPPLTEGQKSLHRKKIYLALLKMESKKTTYKKRKKLS